jgi:hypothetical protein
MKSEIVCCAVVLLALLASVVQSIGCGGCESSIPVEGGSFRVAKVRQVSASEEWLADALIDGQLDVDLESNVATLQYEREGTTYQVRFTISPE